MLAAALVLAVLASMLGGCTKPAPVYHEVRAPDAPLAKPCAAPPTTAAAPTDWLVYHSTADRHGVDPKSPPLHELAGDWGAALDGSLLASPVVVGDLVVAATENDTVYGFSATTGCLAWSSHLGEAVDATKQKCFPFPKIGITGTPAIDPAAGLVYLVAYLDAGVHRLYAIDLASGKTRYQRDIDPAGSEPASQLTRPALTLANGRVYLAFGGRAGDCGNYHGYVLGLAPDLAGAIDLYTVPSVREGGIWAPAGLTVMASGDLLVATGNGASMTDYDGGNSVLRLSPTLKLLDSFAPSNWSKLNARDLDLGSVGPTLVDGDRVFQVGKEGTGYLLDAAHLGGIGGQLAAASLRGCYAIGGTAYRAPTVYVPCDHGMKAVDIGGKGGFEVKWTTLDIRSGSPIVAGGVVWDIDFEGGYLYAFNPADGAVVLRSNVGVSQHFVSPSASAGRLFVPAGNWLLAYSGV